MKQSNNNPFANGNEDSFENDQGNPFLAEESKKERRQREKAEKRQKKLEKKRKKAEKELRRKQKREERRARRNFGFWSCLLLFLPAAFFLQNKAEDDYIKQVKAHRFMSHEVVELPLGNKVDPSFENKVVYATGTMYVKDAYKDPAFNYTLKVPKLVQKAKYYQLMERRYDERVEMENKRDTVYVTYTYEEEWTDKPVLHSYKETKNPNKGANAKMAVDTVYTSTEVFVGPYRVSKEFINSLKTTPIDVPIDSSVILFLNELNKLLNKQTGNLLHVDDSELYIGYDPENPAIDDVRIDYEAIEEGPVSIIGKVTNGTLAPTKYEGAEISTIMTGSIPYSQMAQTMGNKDLKKSWLIRLGLTLLFFIALMGILFKRVRVLGIVFLAIAMSAGVFAYNWMKFDPSWGWWGVIATGLFLILSIVAFVVRRRSDYDEGDYYPE